MTVAVIVHSMGWTEVTDINSYGSSCVLDGTD